MYRRFGTSEGAIGSVPLAGAIIDRPVASATSTVIRLQIGSTTYTIDGVAHQSDVAPFIIEGRTMIPVRLVGEAFGSVVDWYEETQSIQIQGSRLPSPLVINESFHGQGIPIMVEGRTFVSVAAVTFASKCRN